MTVESSTVNFALAAGASNRQAQLQLPVLCNNKKVTLKLVLDLSKTPTEKASVPVRLTP